MGLELTDADCSKIRIDRVTYVRLSLGHCVTDSVLSLIPTVQSDEISVLLPQCPLVMRGHSETQCPRGQWPPPVGEVADASQNAPTVGFHASSEANRMQNTRNQVRWASRSEVNVLHVSEDRLLRSLGVRTRVAIKRQLQGLWRSHSAANVFLWMTSSAGRRTRAVEFAGDPHSLPRTTYLGPLCAVCEQRRVDCVDGEPRELVLLFLRMWMGAPLLVLGLTDSRAPFTDVLTDDVEAVAERIEEIVVDALEPAVAAHAPRR